MPRIFFIPILICITGFLLFGSAKVDPLGQNNLLDLRDAETVRVLILEREQPNVIRINAKESPINFRLGDKSLTLQPADGFAFLFFEQDHIRLQIDGRSQLVQKVIIENPAGLIQLFSTESGTRYYRGDFDISRTDREKIQIINSVRLEDYVTSVIGSEMNFTETDALKSQAVVSRTYTLWSIHRSEWTSFHLKDHEQNQVYLGELPGRPDYAEAAKATAGEILTWSDKLILAAYSSTCGGVTGNNIDVWDGDDLPYLNSVNDYQMCEISPHFEWETDIPTSEFFNFIRSRYGFSATRFDTKTHPSGRINEITFYDSSSRKLSFGGNEFRLILNRHYEDMSLKSTLFTVHQDSGSIHFSGNGLGHGVGMCQWGAKGFANAGWNYSDILSFYFSGTKIVDLNNIEDQKIALSN
jgi:stage II sporulation protein D